jgi:hypothetical protein
MAQMHGILHITASVGQTKAQASQRMQALDVVTTGISLTITRH